MFDKDSDDLIFVNPWDNSVNLSNEERDFLKFAILKINDNRIKNFNPENIENLIKETEEMRKNQYLLSYKIKDLKWRL